MTTTAQGIEEATCIECGRQVGARYHPYEFCLLMHAGWSERRIAEFVERASRWLNPDGKSFRDLREGPKP